MGYREPAMFSFMALEASEDLAGRRTNLEIILQNIADFFSERQINWLTSPRESA